MIKKNSIKTILAIFALNSLFVTISFAGKHKVLNKNTESSINIDSTKELDSNGTSDNDSSSNKTSKEEIGKTEILLKKEMQALLDSSFVIVKSEKSTEIKTEEISSLFDDYLDIKCIGFFALGKYKKEFSKEQKKEYIKIFKKYILKFTSNAIQSYDNQVVSIENIKYDEKKKLYIVETKLLDKDNKTSLIFYHVKYNTKKNKFKIINTVSSGQDKLEIDLKNTLRTLFTSAMSENNQNPFEQLIRFLETKKEEVKK